MRIAIVNNHWQYAPGGSELQSHIIAREMAGRGHYVAYIAPGSPDIICRTSYDVNPCRKDAGSIIRAVLESRPDIVYWRYYRSYLRQVQRAVKVEHIPFVFVVCNRTLTRPWFTDRRVKNPVIRVFKMLRDRWQYGAIERSDIVVSINRELLGKIRAENKTCLPLVMDEDYRDFDWPVPYCAWVSNLRRVKRPEKFIRLAERMRDTEIAFLMAGRVLDENYRYIEEGKGCPGNLHYIGQKSFEEINGILRNSLFHVHTCEPEGFGNVFVQAWMQGRPSLSLGFDPGGYIREYNIGFVADNDMERFERYARELIENKDLREEMGVRAYESARGLFSVERGINDLENLFLSIIKGKGPGSRCP